MGFLFFQIAAGSGDAVDGGEDLGLVLEVGAGEAGEANLFALEVGEEVDEGWLIGLEDAIHAGLLIGAEAEFVGGAVIVPPASFEAQLQAHAGLAAGVEAGAIEAAVARCGGVHAGGRVAHHAAGVAGSHGMGAAAVLGMGRRGEEAGQKETHLRNR